MTKQKSLFYINSRSFWWCLFLLLVLGSQDLIAQKVSFEVSQKTPAAILDLISDQLNLRFSFPSEILNKEEIDFKADDENLDFLLNRLLKPYRLGFEFIEGDFIAIKPIEDVGVLLKLVVVDAVDLQPLPFSTIRIQDSFKGTQADEDGVFDLFVRAPAESILEINYLGYTSYSNSALEFYYQESDTLFLEPDIISLSGIVVSEYLNAGIISDLRDNSIEINPDELNVLPGLSEPDALYSLQQIPGISSSTEAASDINIRGGTSDQVSIYWDNIPVYHSAHYFGLISSFIPSSVDDISVYRNSVPIKYGGSASGLISMNSETEPKSRVHGNADFNMTHISGAFSIPVIKNKMSMYIAGRRSLNDYLSTPTFVSYNKRLFEGSSIAESQNFAVEEEFDFDNILLFWDINAKVNIRLNERNQFSASYFRGKNTLDFTSIDQDLRTADFQYHNVDHSGLNANLKTELTSN